MTDTLTPLDRALLAAQAPEAGDAAMARFYALLVETALCAPVTPTAEDTPIAPVVFDIAGGPVALAFDDDSRMVAFFEQATDYVTLTGRSLIGALAESGLGLGLNLGDAPSAVLLDSETVRWIAAEMGGAVEALDLTGALVVGTPSGAPRALLAALSERIAQMPGLVAEAWLVSLAADGQTTGLAVLWRPAPAASRAIAGVVTVLGRAAAVHGAEAGSVAVGVVAEGDALLRAARTHGASLHPEARAVAPMPSRPGDTPPRLR